MGWHRRYKVGDVQPKESMSEWARNNITDDSVVLQVYMMDHSGLSFKTSAQSFKDADPAGFDWGLAGYIVATPEAMKRWFGVEEINDKIRQMARGVLEQEIHTYNLWQQGEVWSFTVVEQEICDCCGHIKSEEIIDSCCGFIGETLKETELADNVPKSVIDQLQDAWENRKG